MMKHPTKRSDNRKALPKFLASILIATLLGGVVGYFSAMAVDSSLTDSLPELLGHILTVAAPWGIPVSAALLLLPSTWLLVQSKRLAATWDGEEEALPDAVEQKLSYVILLTSIAMVLGFFFLAAVMVYPSSLRAILGTVGAMGLAIVWEMLLQQKTVDLIREINPEKQGSVYDTNFSKKWMESCDEAQKKEIGEAAFQAFRFTGSACIFLWALLMFAHVAFDVGLLAISLPLVIFLILQVSYQLYVMKNSWKRSH